MQQIINGEVITTLLENEKIKVEKKGDGEYFVKIPATEFVIFQY